MTPKMLLLIASALAALIGAAYVLHHPSAMRSISESLGH